MVRNLHISSSDKNISALFIGSDIFNAIFGSLASSGVSCGAHLGGAIVGLGVAMLVLRNISEDDCEKYTGWALTGT